MVLPSLTQRTQRRWFQDCKLSSIFGSILQILIKDENIQSTASSYYIIYIIYMTFILLCKLLLGHQVLGNLENTNFILIFTYTVCPTLYKLKFKHHITQLHAHSIQAQYNIIISNYWLFRTHILSYIMWCKILNTIFTIKLRILFPKSCRFGFVSKILSAFSFILNSEDNFLVLQSHPLYSACADCPWAKTYTYIALLHAFWSNSTYTPTVVFKHTAVKNECVSPAVILDGKHSSYGGSK